MKLQLIHPAFRGGSTAQSHRGRKEISLIHPAFRGDSTADTDAMACF